MDDILRQIERTYTSLREPTYVAITEAMSRQPYRQLVDGIGTRFGVVDTTDVNDDVSFVYGLFHGGQKWALALSAVGPYAVLARTDPARQLWTGILTPATVDLDDRERWLLDAVRRQGLRPLDRTELEHPVALELAGFDPARVRVYQALFTAADILPWDGDTLHRLGLG